ncbi:MAG: serine/threonine protein kinase [Planctomycetia bacterium]
MNLPDPETFWSLVSDSGLVESGALQRMRRECRHRDTADIARWLIEGGSLSTWQARRVARGDRGPYFIGDYRLMERIDAVGPGLLFRARHETSGDRVQLRLLDRPLCKHQDIWTGIVRRTTIAQAVRHPILSRTIALEKKQSQRFVLCEDVARSTLAEELDRHGSQGIESAGRIALEVAQAVAELHRLGDVHGAISLETVRREPPAAGAAAGRLRLVQFPLAGDPHLQPPRIPIDSPAAIGKLGKSACFVAPELVRSRSACDARSDVYAIGCLVHALVAGAAPGWQGDAHRTLARAAASGLPPLGPRDATQPLASVVARMTSRDPRSRYASAVEAADAIASCLGMPPVSASPPPLQVSVPPAALDAESIAVAAPFADPSIAIPMIDMVPESPRSPRGPTSSGRRKPARSRGARSRASIWVTGSLLAVAALGAVALIMVMRNGTFLVRLKNPPSKPAVATSEPGNASRPSPDEENHRKEPAAKGGGSQEPAANSPAAAIDDPARPWLSPTSGGPPALVHLPPGSQLILLARPSEIVADEDGRLFLDALGPYAGRAIESVQQLCGCGLDGIEELQAGWQAGGPGEVIGGYAIRLRDPADADAIVSRIDAAEPESRGNETLHVGRTRAVWMPSSGRNHIVVCGHEKLVREVFEADAKAGPAGDGEQPRLVLPRDMETLAGMLDGSRHATLFGSPHDLRTEARDMLTGPLEPLVEPLGVFFGDSVRAAALSIHFGENFYIELDAVETVNEPARVMTKNLRKKIDSMAVAVEDWITGLVGARYGRKLINRLPVMVKFLAAQARVGAEGKGVVMNAYLPRHAGHNLALAAELALAQAGAPGATAAAAPPPAAGGGEGARQKLQKKTSLSFKSDTLEQSIKLLEEDIGLRIEILGGDLKLDGITKNNSFALDENDKPAEEILRVILLKANPDGKLVYVIRGAGEGDSVVVTTRAQAAERGDTLPPVFESTAPKKP